MPFMHLFSNISRTITNQNAHRHKHSVLRRQSRDINRHIKRLVYCQYGQYSLKRAVFSLRKGQCSKRYTILSVLAVHRPFYISALTVLLTGLFMHVGTDWSWFDERTDLNNVVGTIMINQQRCSQNISSVGPSFERKQDVYINSYVV